MAKTAPAEPAIEDVLAICHGAYSIRTTKGYAADLRIFVDWCTHRGAAWLPATPAIVAAFVDEQVARYRISTIKRRLCAIAFAHRMRDLPTPTDTNLVRLSIRRASRQRACRPQQKRGLTHEIRHEIVAACPASLAGFRDAAIISVGYDTLCRSSELSAMLVEHLELQTDGSGCVLIPRTKADVAGEGRLAHLSPDTVKLLRRWIAESELKSGPLFRSLHLHRVADGAICTSSIRRLIKRATERAGLDPELTSALSGHSMRIGAAQDMLVGGFDAIAIMQAGGWKSTNVVLRYVENAATRELHESRWELIAGRGHGRGT
jgi:integrase